LSKPAYRFFLFLIVFSPLAFGATEPWSIALVAIVCLLACLLCLMAGRAGHCSLYRPPGLVALLSLAGFMLFQLVPLPPAALQLISPATWQIYRDTIWVASPGSWMPISVAPEATLAQFIRLCAYGAFYLLTTQLLSVQERLKKILTILTVFAGLYSLVGILQFFLPGDRILWVLKTWPEHSPHGFGTYVNGNHYAGMMEMLLPLLLCWFLAIRPRVRYGSWRETFVDFLGHPRTSPYVLAGLTVVLVGVSIFFSLSRGGILSSLGSLCLLGLFFLLHRGNRKTGILIILFMGLILTSVGRLDWDPIFARFDRIRDSAGNLADQRPEYWQDSSKIIRDFPLAGTGFGTFIHIYPRYQTARTGNLFVDHAHNDYIELLTDGGMIGALLVFWFLVALWVASFRALKRRKNQISIFLTLGSFAGMVALGLHSFTDFNFYIGANGLYFFFLAGLMASASHGRSRKVSGHWSDLQPLADFSAKLAITATGLILPLTLVVCLGGLMARESFPGGDPGQLPESDLSELKRSVTRAIWLDPLNAHYRRASARLSLVMDDPDAAIALLTGAIRMAPMDGQTLQQLAQLLDQWGKKEQAAILMRTGARNDGTRQSLILTYAAWLLGEGRREEAFSEIRVAMRRAPEDAWVYLAMMFLHKVNVEDMRKALPETGLAYTAYGSFLLSSGRRIEAEHAYRSALAFAKIEEKPSRRPFWTAYKFFEKEKRYEEALQVLLDGVETFPADAGLRRTAGALYQRLGLRFRAAEEYRQSLLLDPKNQWVRNRLNRLEKGD